MILSRSEFEVRFLTPLRMDDFPSAGWRSGLGTVLRQLWCDQDYSKGSDLCKGCACQFGCHWETTTTRNPVTFYEGRSNTAKGDLPKPYILDALDSTRQSFGAGDSTRVALTLIGHSTLNWWDWAQAFHFLGERGLGADYKKGNGRFIVERIYDGDGITPISGRNASELMSQPTLVGPEVWENRAWELMLQGGGHRLTLNFLRPLTIRQGKHDVDLSQHFTLRLFWNVLVKRIEDLSKSCAGIPLQLDFEVLAVLADTVRVADKILVLRRQERTKRMSERSEDDIKVFADGFVGHVTLQADDEELAQLLPILALGEWFHAGRFCDMGNGAFRLLAR